MRSRHETWFASMDGVICSKGQARLGARNPGLSLNESNEVNNVFQHDIHYVQPSFRSLESLLS